MRERRSQHQHKLMAKAAGSSDALKPKFHYHKNENGILVKCYHETKTQLQSISFWVGITISFPIEHFIWEKIPPFAWIAHLMGL